MFVRTCGCRISPLGNLIFSRFTKRVFSTEVDGQKKSIFKRFREMYRDYWYVVLPVHVATSICWIGGFYELSKSGVDVGHYMRKVGISESIVTKITESGAGHWVVAYGLYKVATPARYAVTLGGTTVAINSLRNLGYIKPASEIISKNKAMIKKKIAEKQAKH